MYVYIYLSFTMFNLLSSIWTCLHISINILNFQQKKTKIGFLVLDSWPPKQHFTSQAGHLHCTLCHFANSTTSWRWASPLCWHPGWPHRTTKRPWGRKAVTSIVMMGGRGVFLKFLWISVGFCRFLKDFYKHVLFQRRMHMMGTNMMKSFITNIGL